MYLIRRWWDRYGQQAMLAGLALGVGWTIWQTKGSTILELYYWVTRPFQWQAQRADILEAAHVSEHQARIFELESQNQHLRSLLDHLDDQKRSAQSRNRVVVPVIGRSADRWWQQVIVGRGQQDGLETGFVVTGIGGVVGRITHVTPHTSRVLLLSDPTSRVGVTISRSRAMGFIRGQGNQRALVKFFDKVPDVRPGDVVVTSTLSQLFPAGLPVGHIEAVDLQKSPVPEATVVLSAPTSHLEWVMAFPNAQGSVIENPHPSPSKLQATHLQTTKTKKTTKN